LPIFQHSDYKAYVLERIEAMPKSGRGEFQKISQTLSMHSTRVSHIFRGDMHLTIEQAAGLCRYWGMAQVEAEYFLVLVQLARAGTEDTRKILKGQAQAIRARSKELVTRVPQDRVLTESEKGIFYSSWQYSATRLLTSIDEFQTLESLATRLEVTRERMREILDFLVETGLCVVKNERYQMGPKTTHLESNSPLIARHHANWRLKALSRHEKLSVRELAYTCPVSLNKKDQEALRELLVQTVQSFLKTVTASEPSDMVACLTIDWFEV